MSRSAMTRSAKIIESVEAAKNRLGYRDAEEINDIKILAAKELEKQEAETVLNDVNTENELKKIENEKKLLNAKAEQSGVKLNNMNLKIREAQQNRLIKFNDQLSANKEREIPEYTKKAKHYRILSMVSSIISALTSCLGLYFDRYGEGATDKPDNIMVASFVAMIVVSIVLNITISNLATLNKKFINRKQRLDKILQNLMYTVIIFCMSYSIFTNFIFWSSVNKNMVSAVMYASIFDISAVVLCLMVYKYDSLEFKQEYLDDVNNLENKNESDNDYFRGNLTEENRKRNDADELEVIGEKTKKLREALEENDENEVIEFEEKRGLTKL